MSKLFGSKPSGSKLFGRFAAIAVAAIAVLVGLAAPPAAAAPVTFANGCGYVEVQITGVGGTFVRILRQQVTVRQFTVGDALLLNVGAAPGEKITVQGPGQWDHTYARPAGCTAPDIRMGFISDGCVGNTFIRAENNSPSAVAGSVITIEGHELPATFPIGASYTGVAPLPAGRYQVVVRINGKNIFWMSHGYTDPGECDVPDLLESTFLDACTGAVVQVLPTVDRPVIYRISRNGESEAFGFTAFTPDDHFLAAQSGDLIQVYLLDRPPSTVFTIPLAPDTEVRATSVQADLVDVLDAEHTYVRPATCPTSAT